MEFDEMRIGGTVETAKSLVVGFLIDQVRARSRILLFAGGFAFVASVVLVVVLDGVPRLLAVLSALLGAAIVIVVWLLRAAATRLLGRFADPLVATAHEEAVNSTLAELDLPTGPVSSVRFAWRLRKGTGAEIERVTEVVGSLRDQLDAV